MVIYGGISLCYDGTSLCYDGTSLCYDGALIPKIQQSAYKIFSMDCWKNINTWFISIG